MMKPGIYIFLLFLFTVSCDGENNDLDEFYPHANQIDTIRHDGDLRTYKLYVPDSYSETNQSPLVIALHGYGNTASEMEQTSRLNYKANTEGFIVAFPNGKDYPKGDNSTQIWNAGTYREEIIGNTDDVGFINEMIDLISKHYNIDEQMVFATGFSNGGSMCYKLAAELSCKLTAIAPHSGVLQFSPSSIPECTIPILHLHGSDDGIAAYKQSSVDNILCVWNNWEDCTEQPEIIFENTDFLVKKWKGSQNVLYLSKNGRHSWFTESKAGFNATDVIWDFFSEILTKN